MRVDVWDRFGEHLATPLDEVRRSRPPGNHVVGRDRVGREAAGGIYIYRVTMGDCARAGPCSSKSKYPDKTSERISYACPEI